MLLVASLTHVRSTVASTRPLVHRVVCLFMFSGTHCTYSRRDGQAELTLVADYVYTEMVARLLMVTHPGTRRAQHTVTPLIERNVLTTTCEDVCGFTKMSLTFCVARCCVLLETCDTGGSLGLLL